MINLNAICNHIQFEDINESLRSVGFTESSIFDLTVGKKYKVHGICMMGEIVMLLVKNKDGFPNWYPASIFSITNSNVPSTWCFGYFETKVVSDIKWILGYKELVNNQSHFNLLSEHDPDALKIFISRTKSDKR